MNQAQTLVWDSFILFCLVFGLIASTIMCLLILKWIGGFFYTKEQIKNGVQFKCPREKKITPPGRPSPPTGQGGRKG